MSHGIRDGRGCRIAGGMRRHTGWGERSRICLRISHSIRRGVCGSSRTDIRQSIRCGIGNRSG